MPNRRKFSMLKSANKTETNIYTLEVAVSAEDFKAAVLKAYNKQKHRTRLSISRRIRFSFPASVRARHLLQ